MVLFDWRSAGSGDQLNPRDADFIYNEYDGHLEHLVAVYLFDTGLFPDTEFSQDSAVEWASARLGYHRMFTHVIQRVPLGLGDPYWVPATDFDVRQHVRITTVTEPGWAGLQHPLASVLTTRMDLSRPPWELHFITGITGLGGLPGQLTAVVLKFHHSTGDGLAVVELAKHLFLDQEQPADPLPVVRFVRGRMLARSIVDTPRTATRFARAVPGNRAAARAVAEAVTSGELAEVPQRPATRFNRRTSGGASVHSITLSGKRLRDLKAAVPGATLNDVVLAAVGTALARYLTECDEPQQESLVATVPRSMRKLEAWESSNQLTHMSIDMHTGSEDRMEQLAQIVRSSRMAKARTSHPAVRRLEAAVETLPPPLQRLFAYVRKQFPYDTDEHRAFHTMVSNVPLTVDGLSLNGAPAVGALATQPPVDGDRLRHFIAAGSGTDLTLTVIADPEAMPDLPHYLDLIRSSLTELEEAAAGATKQTPSDEIAS